MEEHRLCPRGHRGCQETLKGEYGGEFFSVGRTIRAIEDSDVVCLVIDGEEGITRQDKRLGGLIERRMRGCVIVVNKMDLCPYSEEDAESIVRKELFFLDYAPITFTVATEGKGVESVLEKAVIVYRDFTRQHKTSFVNRAVAKVLREKPPPHYRGKEVKVFYAFQESTKPPAVVLITNYPDGWKESYRRFFTKKLREYLNIKNAPLKLVIRGRE
ncbi:MAG: GTP-binding protein [Aquificota bacterium]|nr:GTP-binding protein [Aquificota bacterium]